MKKIKQMRWYCILIFGMMMTYNGFSQTVIKDSSQILLPRPLVRLAIKDLIRYDGLKNEHVLTNSIINMKDSIILSDSIKIAGQNKVILNLNHSLDDSQRMLENQQKINQSLDKEISRQKRITLETGVISGGVGIIIGILIKTIFIK